MKGEKLFLKKQTSQKVINMSADHMKGGGGAALPCSLLRGLSETPTLPRLFTPTELVPPTL